MSTVSKVREAFKEFLGDVTDESAMLEREAEAIREECDRDRTAVLATAGQRLPKGAEDLMALDERLGGILGVAKGIDALLAKKSRMELERDAADKELEPIRAEWSANKTVIKECHELITTLEARANHAAARLSEFDAPFMAVHGHIEKWKVDAPRERLENPAYRIPLWV